MKTKFPHYYRISQEDLLDKFDDCIFIFDACVLLDIFRLKRDLVDKIFNVIEHYKDKICIPYHAASEYFKNINTVLTAQIEKIKKSQEAFDEFTGSFQAQRNYPYITDSASKLLTRLEKQINKDFTEQIHYIEDQLIHGGNQKRMSILLDGKVLEPFSSEEIKEIEKEGAERYANKIPPGWKDAPKNGNRYGDLINWKEILRFAKQNNKSVIFVSNDVKDDWVLKITGKTLGVLPQLLNEFYEEMGNTEHIFHVYTLDRFLSYINEHNNNIVSEATIKDVECSMETPLPTETAFDVLISQYEKYEPSEIVRRLQELNQRYADLFKIHALKRNFWNTVMYDEAHSEEKGDTIKQNIQEKCKEKTEDEYIPKDTSDTILGAKQATDLDTDKKSG